MYCGDETGSFVGDVGSHTGRFGYGGDDSPRYVTPSYAALPGNHPARIPTSCYNYRDAHQDYRNPLRLAQHPPGSAHPTPTDGTPIVDPSAFLGQGDAIENWDAYEALWESAFLRLRVRDKLKHTAGGSGGQNPVENHRHATGVASQTLRPSNVPDTTCVHPLLAISSGCTHQVTMEEKGVGDGSRNGTMATAGHCRQRKELMELTELMVEKFDCPALFVAPTPMLAAFSHGRQTALVVDVGAGGCRATPVVDGLVLGQSQRRNGRGGDWLGHVQWHALSQQYQPKPIYPRYEVQRQRLNARAMGGRRGVFYRWAMQDLMYEMRTDSRVYLPSWKKEASNDTPMFASLGSSTTSPVPAGAGSAPAAMDVDSPQGDPSKDGSDFSNDAIYELPDGTTVDLASPFGRDVCRLPELLFCDSLPFGVGSNTAILQRHHTLCELPLQRLVHASLSAVADVDTRKDLASNILLTGGGSLLANHCSSAASTGQSAKQGCTLEERLSLELSRLISGAYKPKVLAGRHAVERSCAGWIGGSILTSLGSFQQLWLGRAEYEEYGVALAIQRFP